jgi:hypothetical protein
MWISAMAKKPTNEHDPSIASDRQGTSPLDHDVDSGKALSAFRETIARREPVVLEAEKIDTPATTQTRDGIAKNADSAPELNSARVAKEFEALTGSSQSFARENERKPERSPSHRPKRNRFKR